MRERRERLFATPSCAAPLYGGQSRTALDIPSAGDQSVARLPPPGCQADRHVRRLLQAADHGDQEAHRRMNWVDACPTAAPVLDLDRQWAVAQAGAMDEADEHARLPGPVRTDESGVVRQLKAAPGNRRADGAGRASRPHGKTDAVAGDRIRSPAGNAHVGLTGKNPFRSDHQWGRLAAVGRSPLVMGDQSERHARRERTPASARRRLASAGDARAGAPPRRVPVRHP